MLRHAQEHHAGAAFVMKTEDSAFINVPALVRELKANCRNPGCQLERMYFGREVRPAASTPPAKDKGGKKGGGGGGDGGGGDSVSRGGSVADAASAAGDADWSAQTSLREYVPFMLGGGFVLSSDLADVILQVNTQVRAKQESEHRWIRFRVCQHLTLYLIRQSQNKAWRHLLAALRSRRPHTHLIL